MLSFEESDEFLINRGVHDVANSIMSRWSISFKRPHCEVLPKHLKPSKKSLEVGYHLIVLTSQEERIGTRIDLSGNVLLNLTDGALDNVVAIELGDDGLVDDLASVVGVFVSRRRPWV